MKSSNQKRKNHRIIRRLLRLLCLFVLTSTISTAVFAATYRQEEPTEPQKAANSVALASVKVTPAKLDKPKDDHQVTDTHRELLARVIFAEAANQPFEGKIAVGEVIMNRIESQFYPDTVYGVVYEYQENYGGWQFSSVPKLDSITPNLESYQAADAVLSGANVLPDPKDGKLVVFFSRGGENANVAATIGDHIFCYGYHAEPEETEGPEEPELLKF